MLRTLENTVGAAYIGVVASAMYVLDPRTITASRMTILHPDSLFGVTNLQTFFFFRNFSRDRLYLKIFVSLRLAILFCPEVHLNAPFTVGRCVVVCAFAFGVPLRSLSLLSRFLDAFNLFLSAHAVYHYVINGFGKFYALELVVWYVISRFRYHLGHADIRNYRSIKVTIIGPSHIRLADFLPASP